MGDVIGRVFIFIIIFVVLFLILREFWCWYWKINERVGLLREINNKLGQTAPGRDTKVKKPASQSNFKISKTDASYIICERCGQENFNTYKTCQKCGSIFVS